DISERPGGTPPERSLASPNQGGMMKDAVIVSGVRTAIGAFGGSFSDVPVTRLGATVIAEAVHRAGLQPDDVGEAVMGNVVGAGAGLNPARTAAIHAGLPVAVPA